MNLRHLPIVEMRKVYIDNLAAWVEVPVFEQDLVIKLVNEIDWEGLDMWQYKKNLVEHWHNLPALLKARIKEPAVRDELYEALVNENWGLRPGKAFESAAFYTRTESENVMMWYASQGHKGKRPEVIHGGISS